MGEGLASFQNRMRAIPEAVREGVKPSLIRGADMVADAMRSLAAVGRGSAGRALSLESLALAHSKSGRKKGPTINDAMTKHETKTATSCGSAAWSDAKSAWWT